MTIFERLEADHQKVRLLLDKVKGLVDDYPDLDMSSSQDLIEEIGVELRTHNSAEEQVFYTALREKDETNLLPYEGHEEHRVAIEMLDSLESDPLDPGILTAKLKIFRSFLLNHIDEEEAEVFDHARTCLSNEEQENLAIEFDHKKQEAYMRETENI